MKVRLLLPALACLVLAGCNNVNRTLEAIYEQDQAARQWSLNMGSLSPDEIISHAEEMAVADSLNQRTVFGLLDKRGWPKGLSEKANDAIWLVIDHSDLEAQKKYLPLVRQKVDDGAVSSSNYATLCDRILMEEGKPQIYGTQVRMAAQIIGEEMSMQLFLWPVEDAAALDSLRNSLGLSPIGEYLENTGQQLGQEIVWDRSKTVEDF